MNLNAIREDIEMAKRSPEMARHVALDHGPELVDALERATRERDLLIETERLAVDEADEARTGVAILRWLLAEQAWLAEAEQERAEAAEHRYFSTRDDMYDEAQAARDERDEARAEAAEWQRVAAEQTEMERDRAEAAEAERDAPIERILAALVAAGMAADGERWPHGDRAEGAPPPPLVPPPPLAPPRPRKAQPDRGSRRHEVRIGDVTIGLRRPVDTLEGERTAASDAVAVWQRVPADQTNLVRESAEAAIARVLALAVASDDGTPWEHNPQCGGEPTCPACWATSILTALGGCTGCDSPAHRCAAAKTAGKAACCPDCHHVAVDGSRS